jgi:predicted nicotinamide N-methyase
VNVATLPLVPEVRLRLITEECALWRASEKEAAALGFVEPYWAFAWPGGQALARHILDNPAIVRGKRVLDFGSGCAIEGIAAMLAGAHSVLCADIDARACEAALSNAALNGVELQVTSQDLIGRDVDADLVLAGDVFYDAALASRALEWLRSLRAPALIGDPSRGFLDLDALRRVATYRASWDGDTRGEILRDTGVYTLQASRAP